MGGTEQTVCIYLVNPLQRICPPKSATLPHEEQRATVLLSIVDGSGPLMIAGPPLSTGSFCNCSARVAS